MTDKQINIKKQNLFQTFQSAGLEDTLKKEMRMKIIQKLQTFTPTSLSQSFETRFIVSLISEYLVFNRLLYSNSLFLPETGYQGKTLNRNELASFNGINQSTINISILQHIISNSHSTRLQSSSQNRQTQTHEMDFSLSIQQKFTFLENQYNHKLKANHSKQINMTAIRRQIQLQFKQQYDRDIRRFKQFQIQTIRLNQRQKIKRKYQQYSIRLQEQYKQKLSGLRKQTTKMYNKEEEMRKQQEYFNVKQKSSLSQQRQLMRMKEFQMQEKSKLLDMTKVIQTENNRKYQQQLNNKIQQYDSLNLKMMEKINYEVGLVKLSMQKQYQDKQMEFLERKKVVDTEYAKIESIKMSVELIQKQNQRLVQENVEIRKQLQGSLEQIHTLIQDNKQLYHKIDIIKSQKQILEQTKRELEKNKQEMSVRINKCQNQIINTRRELEDARNRIGNYKEQSSEQQQIQIPPTPIHKSSALDDLLKKMDEISRNRRKDIQSLKEGLDQ